MTQQVNIGEVIINALVFDPKRSSQLRALNVNELLASVASLFDLLGARNINYLLVGGIAMLTYVEGRNTQDIDLVMSADDLARLPELVIEDRNAQLAPARFGQLQVDVLLSDDPLFRHVLQNCALQQQFMDQTVPCATVEGLLLMKLYALPSLYRQGQFSRVELYERDITMLLRDFQPDIDEALTQLTRFLSTSDLAEIRSIVADIQLRIAKANQRFKTD